MNMHKLNTTISAYKGNYMCKYIFLIFLEKHIRDYKITFLYSQDLHQLCFIINICFINNFNLKINIYLFYYLFDSNKMDLSNIYI